MEMGQKTRLNASKATVWMRRLQAAATTGTLLSSMLCCSHGRDDSTTDLLRWLNVRVDKSICERRDILGDSPSESLKQKIELPKLDHAQKALVLRILPFFDSTSAIQESEAYVYSVQERRPGIVTLAILTSSNYGNLLFLENWRGLQFTGFLVAGDGNAIGNIEEKNSGEIVRVSREWFEMHGDTVCKITRGALVSHFFDGRAEIESPVDSAVEVYVINNDGNFIAVGRDSVVLTKSARR
jgi:hypothetical protein